MLRKTSVTIRDQCVSLCVCVCEISFWYTGLSVREWMNFFYDISSSSGFTVFTALALCLSIEQLRYCFVRVHLRRTRRADGGDVAARTTWAQKCFLRWELFMWLIFEIPFWISRVLWLPLVSCVAHYPGEGNSGRLVFFCDGGMLGKWAPMQKEWGEKKRKNEQSRKK